MDADKFIQMQHQMRVNNSELQDFLRDVNSWQKDVKSKEAKTSKGSTASTEAPKQIPPVRGTNSDAKASKTSASETVKPARISGYDYRSWDKFDVDKALEDADQEPVPSSKSTESVPTEPETQVSEQLPEVPQVSLQQKRSLELKDTGNDFLKRGLFERAIESYSEAIQLDDSNAVLYANRAAAYLKIGTFGKAEQDCNTAIRIDGTYSKAFYRRASARKALKRYAAAIDDLETVHMLEPSDNTIQREIQALREVADLDRPGLILPLTKPPANASKKPLRRVPVEEVSTASVSSARSKQAQSAADFISPKTATVSNSNSNLNNVTNKLSANSINQSTAVDTSTEAPATLFQLMAETREFRVSEPLKFYSYLSRIPSASFVRFFGDSLDNDLLTSVLRACHAKLQELRSAEQAKIQADVTYLTEALTQLSKVKRFGTVVMFLGSNEKKLVREICDNLSSLASSLASANLTTPTIESIKKAYL